MLAQAHTWLALWQHVPPALFVFCFGAAVGSFLNVVNHRLPAGMSVISPPSRCPTCGARLRFFRENLPIIGWFAVRGRCRYCGARISPEYMFLELAMALAFLGLYALLYAFSPSTPWWGEIGGAWWYLNSFFRTWAAYIVLAFLIAGLVSMTMIDARTFTIPIQVPLFVTISAFILYPIQALLPARPRAMMSWPIPGVSWFWSAVALGGLAGILVGLALLRSGRLRYSFADYHEYVAEDQTIGVYPHARREMVLELRYLLPCILGMIAGGLVAHWWLPAGGPPPLLQAFTASLVGYLVGAGLIWGIRILGTLAFGREAMGLGDVHLLGAVGAVLGWVDPIMIFFLAPLFGLLWVILSMGLGTVFRRLRRELPYGPHLALGTLAVIMLRPGIEQLWSQYMGVPLPSPGLLP